MAYLPDWDQSNPKSMVSFLKSYPGASWDPTKTFEENVAIQNPTILTPTLNTGAIPTVAPPPPITFDPLLSPANILQQSNDAIAAAKAPITDSVNAIVAPQIPLLTKQLNDQLNINKASAASDFTQRGLTGSSTEIQTLTRDLPEAANKALAEGTVKLMTAAYPIAAAEKATIVDSMYKTAALSTQLRGILGDEAFKNMSLSQQAALANQDVHLKLSLADIEMKFQAAMKEAEFRFTAAENDKDRAVAQQQFEYLQSERQKARQGAFIKSLTTLAGIGIAIGTGPAGMTAATMASRAAVGGMAGGEAGNAFGNLFLLE